MTHLDATRGLLGNLTSQIEEMRKFVRLQRAELHQLNQAVLRKNRTIANLRLDRSTKDAEIRRLAAKVAYLVENPGGHPAGPGFTYPPPGLTTQKLSETLGPGQPVHGGGYRPHPAPPINYPCNRGAAYPHPYGPECAY